MDTARWSVLQSLFDECVALPEAARASFVAQRCGDDAALSSQLLAMLAADGAASPLLDGGVGPVARTLLDIDPAAAAPPIAFGPYRPIRLLGEGGMGVVYLAERADLGSDGAR